VKGLKQIISFVFHHPLAKKHKLKAIWRFLNWQIQCRLSNKLHKKRFINNIFFYAKKGLNGITGNIYVGLHEFEDMAFIIHFLREDDVFFDVGANVGSYSLLASGINKTKSIAFEPSKKTMDLLRKNISLNKLEDLVDCIQIGIGREKTSLWFTKNEDTTNHFTENQECNSELMEIEPLDSFFLDFHPSAIKIDVEGFETNVLCGSKSILDSEELKVIIIELNGSGLRYGYHDSEIHETLLRFGFLPYLYDPFKRSLSLMNIYGDHNTLYIKDIDFVENRVKNALCFSIFDEAI